MHPIMSLLTRSALAGLMALVAATFGSAHAAGTMDGKSHHAMHGGKMDHAAMVKMHRMHGVKMDHAAMMKMHRMHHGKDMTPATAAPMKMAMAAPAKSKGPGQCGTYMYWKAGACLDSRMKK
jgi:uncharacterized protein involved in copper resistance